MSNAALISESLLNRYKEAMGKHDKPKFSVFYEVFLQTVQPCVIDLLGNPSPAISKLISESLLERYEYAMGEHKNPRASNFYDNFLQTILPYVTEQSASVSKPMDPMIELFLKNFREKNLEGCQHLINHSKFDVTHPFTQKELLGLPNIIILDNLNILHLVAKFGEQWSHQLIPFILKRGVDINLQNAVGRTALMLASANSNTSSSLETVEALISAGANLDLRDNGCWTALMLASCHSNETSSLQTVEALIHAGANLDLQNEDGCTALIISSKFTNESCSLETIKALIRAGANLDLQNIYGSTALIMASTYYKKSSSLETVETLIYAGANLDLQDRNGSTALISVVAHSNNSSSLETVKAFIRTGANLDLQNKGGFTALMSAIKLNRSLETVKTLIHAGANLNLQTIKGSTVLTLAVENSEASGSLEIEIVIKMALLTNESFQNYNKLVQEFEQAFENLHVQIESELDELKTQIRLCNISRMKKIEGSRICDICLELQTNVTSCSQDDCGVVCGTCLTWYLESDPELIPVSSQKVPGVYCLISQKHVHILNHLMRSLMSMSIDPKTEEHLERLDLSLQSRYFSEQANLVRVVTATETLETFRAEGQISSTVRTIENTILCDVCPNCQCSFVSDGCEAVKCKCGFHFCNVCLVFKTRDSQNAHAHVRECILKNSIKATEVFFLDPKERETWRNQQRYQKIQEFLESSGTSKNDWTLIMTSLLDKHPSLMKAAPPPTL